MYEQPDGSRVAEISSDPIHFTADDGSWKEIDNTLTRQADGTGYVNAANDLDVKFAGSGSSSSLVDADYGAKALTLALAGASNTQPSASGNKITYPNVLPGADLTFEVSGETIKEYLVLKSKPKIPSGPFTVRFPFNAQGLTVVETGSGGIDFRNASGETVFSIPHLFMYDSYSTPESGGEHAISENIQLGVEQANGQQYIKVTADGGWLTSSQRVYPVYIDPTITGKNPSLDTFVQSNILNTPQNTSTELKSGYYSGPEGTFTARSLLKFDLSAIPSGANISAATLSLWENHSYSCQNRVVEVYRVTSGWGDQVTWSNKPGFAASPADTKNAAKGYSSACPGGRVDFDVSSIVNYWKNSSATNDGFGIRAQSETDTYGWKKFASDQATNRPLLDVTYNTPPDAPDPQSPTGGVTTGPEPTLKAIFKDQDAGDWGHVDFQVWNATDCANGDCSGTPVVVVHSGTGTNPGGVSTFDVPAHQLADGGDYKWRGRGDDGKAQGPWSTPVAFHVSVDPPGAPTITSSPNSPSNNSSPSWSFSGASGNTFECQLLYNGGVRFGWAQCSSPKSYDLSQEPDGTYALQVRQVNDYGKSGAAAQSPNYVLDRQRPDPPNITGSPPSPGNNPNPSWSFTGESGAVFECQLKRDGVVQSGFSSCTSAKQYTLSQDGTYTFSVHQKDQAGNVSGDAESTYVFDSTRPAAPNITSSPASPSSNRRPSWSFTGESNARFECRLVEPASTPGFSSCNSPATYDLTGKSDATYRFEVRQIDQAGNVSDPATRNYVLDSQAPDPPQITARPTSPSKDPSPTWSFTGESGASFDCRVTRGPDTIFGLAGCVSPKSYDLSQQSDGTYTFGVRQTDAAGNQSGFATDDYVFDRTPPGQPRAVVSTSHVPGVALKDKTIDVVWQAASDNLSGIKGYSWVFRAAVSCDKSTQGADCDQGAAAPADGSINSDQTSATSAELDAGRYWFHVRAVDRAGNVGDEVVIGPFLVDPQGSVIPLAPTLNDVLVAESDTNGLEQFYPYRSFDLGTYSAYTNLHDGNLVVQGRDVTIPGKGLNTVIRHTYNAQRNDPHYHDTGVGRGWTLSLADADAGLDPAGAVTDLDLNTPVVPTFGDVVGAVGSGLGGILELTDGDGTVHRFVRRGDPGSRWDSPPGVALRVKENLDPTDPTRHKVLSYDLIRPDGVVYRVTQISLPTGLSDTWHVSSISDRNGNKLTLNYARVDNPAALSINKLRVVSISHNRSDSDPVVQMSYDASGNLQSITSLPNSPDASETRRIDFTIDADGYLKKVTENADLAADKQRVTSFGYDAYQRNAIDPNDDVKLLSAVTDGEGQTTSLEYDDGSSTGLNRLTKLCDREDMKDASCDSPWTVSYGDADPNTGERTTRFIPAGHPDGDATSYRISGRGPIGDQDPRVAGGNILHIADAGSPSAVTSDYQWKENRLVSKTDGAGNTTTMAYNDLGLLTEVTSPPPNVDRDTRPSDAPVSSITTSFVYEAVTDPKFSYDSCSAPSGAADMYCNTVAQMVRAKAADNVDSQRRITDFVYDADGNMTCLIQRAQHQTSRPQGASTCDGVAPDPGDRMTGLTYFDFGGLHEIHGPRSTADDTTFGDYFTTGMPQTITDAEGHQKSFTYSRYGTASHIVDRGGRDFRMTYDQRDNLKTSEDPAGNITTYTYDFNDNKRTVTTPRGNTSTLTYNANEMNTRSESPGSTSAQTSVTKTTYNADGTTHTAESAIGAVTTYDYYPNQQLKRVTSPVDGTSDAVTDYVYDSAGRQTDVTLPRTNSSARPSRSTTYTPSGAVASIQETSAIDADAVTRFAYDALGERIQVLGPRSNSTTTEEQIQSYDPFGEVVRVERRLSQTKSLVYTYDYDLAGNQISATQPTGDADRLTASYDYDKLNRLIAQTDPQNPGHHTEFSYLPEGQQEKRKDFKGDALKRTVTTTYNVDYTVRSVVSTDNSTATTPTLATCNWGAGDDPSSGYDRDQNLLVSRSVKGTTGCDGGDTIRVQRLSYDNADRVSQVVQQVQAPGAASVKRQQDLEYNDDGTLKSSTWDGNKTTYAFTNGGLLKDVTDWRPNPETVHFDYLPSGAYSAVRVGPSATGDFGYHADGSMSRLVWNAQGIAAPVRSHTNIAYDVGGLRTGEDVSIVEPTTNPTGDTGGHAAFDYDLASRLTGWTSPFRLSETTPNTDNPRTDYTLDDGGNITREQVTASGVTYKDTTSSYTNSRLESRSTKTFGLVAAGVNTTTDMTFGYSSLGEEITRHSSTQVLSVPPSTDTEDVATDYDPGGHTNKVDNSGTNAPADVDYLYSADGQVIARTSGSKTTYFFYFLGSSRLAEETRPSGATKTRYLNSADGSTVAEQRFADAATGEPDPTNSSWVWLLRDPDSNVATELKETATGPVVISQRAYDPYGSPDGGGTSKLAGEDKSKLGYQGERTDEDTGNVLLGPRVYDPTTDRFTTADFFPAGTADIALGTDPLTGNRYVFAAANPVAFYENGYMPLYDCDCPGKYNKGSVPEPPPRDPGDYATRANQLEPTLIEAGHAFSVPPSVLAGTLVTEWALDARGGGEAFGEAVVLRGACHLPFVGSSGICKNHSVGGSQLQVRRAQLVDRRVENYFLNKALAEDRTDRFLEIAVDWSSNPGDIYERLRDEQMNLFYTSAYLDLLREHHGPGASWATVYGTRTSVGEYNVDPDFVRMFQASRSYFSYFDD